MRFNARLIALLVLGILIASLAITRGIRSGKKTPIKLAGPVGIYVVEAITDPNEFDPQEVGRLLGNPAVSGIALRLRWKDLEPSEGAHDLSIIEQTLTGAKQRNKKVSLIIVPGFYTPRWLIDRLVDCDPYLAKPETFSGDCGKALFTVDYGQDRGGELPLPLPWNKDYLTKWKNFLKEIANRYNSDPDLVSIAVAGPTSMSVEMSLPRDNPKDLDKWRRLLELFYPTGDPHRESNLVIIEKWQEMIDFYEQTFVGKSLVVTRGGGLLKFVKRDRDENSLDPQNPQEAKEIVIDYFIKANYSHNQKANQTSGLKSCRESEGGIEGVKETISQGLIGGAQFNSSVVLSPATMGCTDKNYCSQGGKDDLNQQCKSDPDFNSCCRLTPEQALKNILRVYFDNTRFGPEYGGQPGESVLNYLQIYASDIEYAGKSPEFQTILNQVKKDLEVSRFK